jgi:hypothetical protein
VAKARDIRVVAGFEVYRSLRTPQGILFMALFGTLYTWVCKELARLPSSPLSATNNKMVTGFLFKALAWFASLSEQVVAALLRKHSPVLVAFFFLAIIVTPFMAMMASFDQTASEIGSRHARFVLMRTDRSSMYIGKVVGSVIFFGACMGVATLGAATMFLVAGGSPSAETLTYLVRIWVASTWFAVPIICLMGMTSALTGQAFLSLLMALGLHLFIWMASSIGSIGNPMLAKFAYGFPTAMKFQLLSDRPVDVLQAMAHQALLGGLFFFLGLQLFRKRDL